MGRQVTVFFVPESKTIIPTSMLSPGFLGVSSGWSLFWIIYGQSPHYDSGFQRV